MQSRLTTNFQWSDSRSRNGEEIAKATRNARICLKREICPKVSLRINEVIRQILWKFQQFSSRQAEAALESNYNNMIIRTELKSCRHVMKSQKTLPPQAKGKDPWPPVLNFRLQMWWFQGQGQPQPIGTRTRRAKWPPRYADVVNSKIASRQHQHCFRKSCRLAQ